MTDTTTDLDWGGVARAWIVPGTRAAWGARAILGGNGYVDLVPDRQHMVGAGDDRLELAAWLDGVALPGVRENVERWVRAGEVDGRTTKALILYHDDVGTVFGTPNGSHGYLYMVGFLQDHLPAGHKTRGLELYLDARYKQEEETTT